MVQDQGPNGAQRPSIAGILHTPESALTTLCNCPYHQTPPSKPTQLPFPGTEANRQCFQMWLLNYYRSNTFNKYKHQSLPMKEGVLMRLMVDSNTEPAAHHISIPVSLYWQTDVHGGIDHDMALGVLEEVPVDKPVTWCYHTKPWQTVNFLALHLHIMWETHTCRAHFIKHGLYPVAQRTLFLTAGMASQRLPPPRWPPPPPHLQPHGCDTKQHPMNT